MSRAEDDIRDHFENSDVCDDSTCTPENFKDASRNKRPTELHWYNDAGHGWLAVSVRDLLDSGVAPDISSYSYHDRQTAMVYLEEDCDAVRYLEAFGFTVAEAEAISTDDHVNGDSFIRRLDRYTPEGIRA